MSAPASTTDAARIDYLNIGLMIAACAAAFLAPFQLFLIAYAVLGPLHYLTEISWIHDRGYFIARKDEKSGRHRLRLWLGLVGIALAAMLIGLVAEKVLHRSWPPVYEIGLLYLVLVAAALLAFGIDRTIATIALVAAVLVIALFSASPLYGLVALLLITIVHVLVFTAGFILFGALKTKSPSGVASLGVFVLCVAAVFVPLPAAMSASPFVEQTYAPFQDLNTQLMHMFGFNPAAAIDDIYASSGGRAVMRLIAFAYTYHYLNWFSKTSVIGWHQVSRVRAGVILLLWLGAIAAYAWNYALGFIILYALSVLHVMLELPLNHRTFAGIGEALYGLMPRRAVVATAHAKPSRSNRRKR